MPDIIPLDMPASYWRGKAQQAQRNGSRQEAVRLFRAALRKREDNGIRRDLAQAYADLRCMGASDRLYLENLARDAQDADSVYGLARNRSLVSDERSMADLLDLYLRMAPCGEQADHARDILWQMPRPPKGPRRMRRAEVLFDQASDHFEQTAVCAKLARKSWARGKTSDTAQLLCRLALQENQPRRALRYGMEACRLAPQDMNARLLLASALYQSGMPHACRSALQQAMPLCKGMEQAPLFCQCALGLQQADLAAELAERQLESAPGSADLMLLLALTLRAQDGQEKRAEELLRAAAALDEENPVPRMLLEMPAGSETDAAAQMLQSIRQIQRVGNAAEEDGAENGRMHAELVRLMRLPMPGMVEMAVRLLIKTGDALGLRMVLTENELPPVMCAVILNALEQLREPLPCFARVEGRLCLIPAPPRPPYDADLHDLIRRLLRAMPEGVSLEEVVRRVPPAWRQLPESARRHCAQSRDAVWPNAFSAYLQAANGDDSAAESFINHCPQARRTARAYMQLIRRRNTRNEMHRL